MLMLLKVSVPGPGIGRDSKPMLLKMPEGRVLSVPAGLMGIGPASKDAWKLVRASPFMAGPEGPKKNAMQSRLARGVGTWNSRLSGACRRSHT
jgi:hypothetical protein